MTFELGTHQAMEAQRPMNWNGRDVLVTGAAGFIGSHLVERLVEAGASVRAFVHYNSAGTYGWLDNSARLADIEVVAGEISDDESVSAAMRGIDTVFHLAALIGIPYSYSAPMSYVRVNIVGTLNVLQAARRSGVRRIVHTSTSEVYGSARYVPIDEMHPLQGQSPYSASKIGADKMVESFVSSFESPAVTVRPFNTFGPRQSARAVIPTIITQIISSGVVKLGNVHPTRDLNYVSNTVDGFMLAAQPNVPVGEAINLGTGREISVGDLVAMIAKIAGRSACVEADHGRDRPPKSEVDRLVADCSKAHLLLGWEPTLSLEEGLARTIDWVGMHLERYRAGVYVV